MPARCRIDLTEREALAVLTALSNSADDADEVFHDATEHAAFVRAHEKVRVAWRDKFHPRPTEPR